MAWENKTESTSGLMPSPRSGHGFAENGGQFYVHGGKSEIGSIS